MLASLLVAVLAQSGSSHCLDSYLSVGMHQQRPAQETHSARVTGTAGNRIERIERVVAPPGETIGFLYATADGGRFFGTRTRRLEPSAGAPYVRAIFLRDGLVSRSQLDSILATQDGNAIIYVPNERRLFARLGLEATSCAAAGTSA